MGDGFSGVWSFLWGPLGLSTLRDRASSEGVGCSRGLLARTELMLTKPLQLSQKVGLRKVTSWKVCRKAKPSLAQMALAWSR